MLAALAVGCAATRTGTIVSVSPVAYLQPDSSMAVSMDTEIIVPGRALPCRTRLVMQPYLECNGRVTAQYCSVVLDGKVYSKKRKEKGY